MEQQVTQTEYNQKLFFDVIRKTYEKGMNEKELTIKKIMDDLKTDLKNTLSITGQSRGRF